jgi:hypothetical protein
MLIQLYYLPQRCMNMRILLQQKLLFSKSIPYKKHKGGRCHIRIGGMQCESA